MTDENPLPPGKNPGLFYGYNVVIAAFLIMLLTYGVRTSFGVFFKPMETEFEWSRALISGAVTLSMIVQGLWGIFMGRVNDKIGSRLVITVCCFFLGLGMLLIYFTRYSWHLYLFYGIIIGVGMGGVFVALVSTVTRWFIKKRGAMTGIVLAGIGAGTLIMAPVANWLISLYGWRMSNVILGSLVLVIGMIAAQFLRRDPSKMGLKPYGHVESKEQGTAYDALGMSVKETIRTHQFWMVMVIFACVGYCTFVVSIHLVPHITDLGISASIAANVLATTGGVHIVGGIILGMVADRIGNQKVIIISFAFIAAALFWLIPITTVLFFFIFAVVYSLGIGGGTAMESTITADLFGVKSHGVIIGIVSFGFTIGGAIGPLATGYLFDMTGNYNIAFVVAGSLGVLGIILTAILRPTKNLPALK